MNPTIAIVAQGAMGAGVGARLVERGLRVVTSLAGRTDASAQRAKAAGMVAVSDAECAQADFFLSICPPSDALALAEKMAAIIATADKKPVYVDCNAVSPKRKVVIGDTILNSGAPFVDVGITGLPPRAGHSPTLHAAGPDAGKFGVLNDFGIKVNVIEGPIGAASALKMSYAGITKGMTATPHSSRSFNARCRICSTRRTGLTARCWRSLTSWPKTHKRGRCMRRSRRSTRALRLTM